MLVIAENDMGFMAKVVEIIESRNIKDGVVFTGLLVGEEKLSAY